MTDVQVQYASLAEVRSEMKDRIEQAKLIEDKYEGEITNQEDLAQVKKLLTEVDGLSARANALQEKEKRQSRYYTDMLGNLSRPAPANLPDPGGSVFNMETPGDQFIKSLVWRQHKEAGAFSSTLGRIEMAVKMPGTSLVIAGRQARFAEKALVYSSSAVGGAFSQNDRWPGLIDILQRELTVLDLVQRSGTDSDTIEYVREDTFTNAAAPTAEATATTGTTGTKPESTLAYSVQTSPVRTVAHWIPVTNRMLGDAPAIRGIINGRLLLGLDLTLETQLITGDGTGENLTGLLAAAGVLIQAAGTDTVLDRMFKGRTQVRVTGLARPNAYVVHSNDWQAIRLSRENAATATLGAYLMGPPSQVGATTLWGLPVIESLAITENTGLVGDWNMGATLFDREESAIRTGVINDQFVRNMQTILAELRAGFVIWRPTAFCKVTGI